MSAMNDFIELKFQDNHKFPHLHRLVHLELLISEQGRYLGGKKTEEHKSSMSSTRIENLHVIEKL